MRNRGLGMAVLVVMLSGGPAVAQTDTVAIRVVDDAFRPGSIGVTANTQIVWTNEGTNDHTVTADNGSFESGALEPGDTFTVSIDAPGVFRYHCTIHGGPGGSGMAGTLVIETADDTDQGGTDPVGAGAQRTDPEGTGARAAARDATVDRSRLSQTGGADVPVGASVVVALALVALGLWLRNYETIVTGAR